MLQEITIKNFKSIADDTIELGRVNVFIGENGCGKSNILEAVGFASLYKEEQIENENLISKGIRIAKPSLTISNFKGKKQLDAFRIEIFYKGDKEADNLVFTAINKNEVTSKWNAWHTIDIFFTNKQEEKIFQEMLDEFKQESGIESDNEAIMRIVMDYIKEKREKRLKKNHNLAETEVLKHEILQKENISNYLIYALNTLSLRGLSNHSNKEPVGIYGENLDVLIANFDKEERKELLEYNYLIDWLDSFVVDTNDILKLKGYKLNRSQSTLYFTDKYMMKKNNIFSSENANEGILHVLFYLAVMISKQTPKFFAIDNIESSLNPHLCRHLMTEICKLAKKHEKQLLITTHNPAILDGLNLFDDEIRLFVVSRNQAGHTKTRRVKLKPDKKNELTGENFKLSELWTRGYLGAISENF